MPQGEKQTFQRRGAGGVVLEQEARPKSAERSQESGGQGEGVEVGEQAGKGSRQAMSSTEEAMARSLLSGRSLVC